MLVTSIFSFSHHVFKNHFPVLFFLLVFSPFPTMLLKNRIPVGRKKIIRSFSIGKTWSVLEGHVHKFSARLSGLRLKIVPVLTTRMNPDIYRFAGK